MRIEKQIHSGEVVSTWKTDQAVFIESEHAPGSLLPHHAHRSPHLAVILAGSYFEKIGDSVFLRLAGDEIYYPAYLPHEERFGRLPAKCLNVESLDGSFPSNPKPEPEPAPQFRKAYELASDGRVSSLSALADAVGYHRVYLARAFRSAFGTSVGALLKANRIRKAADLIFRSDRPLAEIALQAGYFDQSHLTNELVREAGFTPGELRRLADS